MSLLIIFLYALCVASVKSLSTDFPSVDDAIEFSRLSKISYEIDPSAISDCSEIADANPNLLYDDLQCLLFKPESNVLVVLSEVHNYVGISYRGTTDTKDWITDVRARLVTFGHDSQHPIAPKTFDVQVHDGFNIDVFKNYQEIHDVIVGVIAKKPETRIVVTGHSLGAANSILCATALATHLPERFIENISYASPLTGNVNWINYVNSLQNLSVWRFVHMTDIIPRSPPFPNYRHPGHTIQLNKKRSKVYYLHYGDEELVYAGVPESWISDSFHQMYRSLQMHYIDNYTEYITDKCAANPDVYYNLEFMQPLHSADLDDIMTDIA